MKDLTKILIPQIILFLSIIVLCDSACPKIIPKLDKSQEVAE